MLGAGLLALLCSSAQALEVPSADVMIQSIGVSPSLTLKVTLYSYWDDTARNVKLQIILPYGLKVSSLPTFCSSVPVVDGTHGSISCDIDDMNVNTTRVVQIQLARVYITNARAIGAFVWNTLPDPMPINNYAHTTLP
jgi:hypothetical protein